MPCRISHERFLVCIANPAWRPSATCLTPAICFSTPDFSVHAQDSSFLHFGTSNRSYSSLPLLRGQQHPPCRQHGWDPAGDRAPWSQAVVPARTVLLCLQKLLVATPLPSKATTGSPGLGVGGDRDTETNPGKDLAVLTASQGMLSGGCPLPCHFRC